MDFELLNDFIDRALQEDIGGGDHTSNACIPKDQRSKAVLLVKDIGVLAGVDLAEKVFSKLDPRLKFKKLIADGEDIKSGDVAFEIECNTRALLKGERLTLNLLQRMSGIATTSSRFAVEVEDLPVKLLDTRKTTPLMRFLEKWAVRIGGCYNYRHGLYDRIMLKDNHIDAAGGIQQAIYDVHRYLEEHDLDLALTIEVRNLVELHEVLDTGGVHRIMMDNFELPLLKEAVKIIDGKFETEASGGINLYNVREYGLTGVDFISVGALTHSAGSLDMSLKISKRKI
ncbi:MAG: carboxylating nicotinate-nucleotide diphosphorylase [Saprospirales bacterium]|nr:MAG: carboxylating nicotinate-nucleotide diphosphorylase [Saprospirales bacterium]